MVDRIKTLVKSIFQFFKRGTFFTRKIDSTERIALEKEPNYDPPLYVYNTHGVIEFLSDQCDNKTCICKDRCQVDDLIFYESALLDDYKQKMRECHAAKKGEDNFK